MSLRNRLTLTLRPIFSQLVHKKFAINANPQPEVNVQQMTQILSM